MYCFGFDLTFLGQSAHDGTSHSQLKNRVSVVGVSGYGGYGGHSQNGHHGQHGHYTQVRERQLKTLRSVSYFILGHAE